MDRQSQENETLTSHKTYLFGNTTARTSTLATFEFWKHRIKKVLEHIQIQVNTELPYYTTGCK